MAIAVVDETGDPGTGGVGREWFAWVACVMPDAIIPALSEAREILAQALPGNSGQSSNWRTASWKDDDLIGTLRYLNTIEGWHWVAVASNTIMSTPTTATWIDNPTEHRYYSMLIMLERLSWYGASTGQSVHVYIERPNDRGFNEVELRARHKRGLPPHKWADHNFLPPQNIKVLGMAEFDLLSIADTLACAVGKAINAHERRMVVFPGETFPEYINIVSDKVWTGPWSGGFNLTDRGFTLLPAARRVELRAKLPFLSRWLNEFNLGG
ncbi:MAG TPA: hypothetical protein VNL15_04185 [Dehalococcoidia bacterium]|nr:hypothetical protein [Dehalococcoidia bacterium]